ncbi:universal stress protein [Nocardia sp. NPDC003345]
MAGATGIEPKATIVVGVEGSEASTTAVRWASETASARGYRLRIVHGMDMTATRAVRNVYDVMEPPIAEAIRHRGSELLSAAREEALRIDPALWVDVELSETGAAPLLIEHSAEAEITVLGASGSGSTLTHLGSTLLAVTAHGLGKIVVARGAAHRHTGPVVVGLDGSSSSEAAAAAAFAEAELRRAALVAVHAWHDLRAHWYAGIPEVIDDPDIAAAADTELRSWLAGWCEKYPAVEVRRELYLAGPDLHLINRSQQAQLVVTGSRGRGGFRGLLLGSTSNILVQRAHCPVLVAHTDRTGE